MSKIYLFSRKADYTALYETTIKEAINTIKQNRHSNLGILCGTYNSIKEVYREYAPFRIVSTANELLNQ